MATPRKTRIKVGVIGLGIIGTRVAANLRGAGHQVYVWSRSPHSAPNFLGSVVEVADLCDVIQIFVGDDAALLEVVRTIAAALSPRHLLAAHPTVSPATVRQAASIVESQGARYLDAPFTGSKAAAQNKQLVYYVGGDSSALEEIRPVLEVTSKKVLHVGKVGDATVLKIATNMLTASTVQTLSEMLALVRGAGIEEQRLVEALENNASRSGTSDLKLPSMIAGNYEPNFSLKHMLKDARLALDLAKSFKLPLPLAAAATDVFSEGIEQHWGDLDFSVVAKSYDALLPRPTPKPLPETVPEPPLKVAAESPKDAMETSPKIVPEPPKVSSEQPPVAVVPVSVATRKRSTSRVRSPFAAKSAAVSEAPAAPAILPTIPAAPAAAPKAPVAASAAPKVQAVPAKPAPIGGNHAGDPPKKNTLRIIRDFFKPAQS